MSRVCDINLLEGYLPLVQVCLWIELFLLFRLDFQKNFTEIISIIKSIALCWFFQQLKFYMPVHLSIRLSVCPLTFCVHSVSPSSTEELFWNCSYFAIPRRYAEHINQSCPMKVKVIFQGQSSNGNILCWLYIFKPFKISSWNFVQTKDMIKRYEEKRTNLLSALT